MRFLTILCLVLLGLQPLAGQSPDEDATQAKLKERDRIWDIGMEAAQAGRLDEATRLFEEVYEQEQAIFGAVHEKLLRTLGILSRIALAKQDTQAAVDYRKRQLSITEQLHGKDHYRTQDARRAVTDAEQSAQRTPKQRTRLAQANQLNSVAVKLHREGQFAQAISLTKQVAETHKIVLGEQHASYATSLNNLAVLYYSMGDYPRAEQLYQQALQINKTVLGEQHPDYANSLNNLGELYRAIGDYPRAELYYKQALQIQKTILGKQHPTYALGLNNLAILYLSTGDYARAETLFQQAMDIRKAVLGEQHPEYATSLHSLAALYQSKGDYPRAEPLFQQSLQIVKAVLGEQHPDYANSMHNLAVLYHVMGDYMRAEKLYQQALHIQKTVLGEQHPEYVTSLHNLAELHRAMGDYAQAETLFQQSLQIRKTVLGEQHPDYATNLNNLANLYRDMGDYQRAEPLSLQSLQIRKTVLGEQHRDYPISLNSLAVIYFSMGDYPRAEMLFQQALRIKKAIHGEHHPDYAISLSGLALLYEAMGDYARAEPLFQQALRIQKTVLGEQHPEYATSLSGLAVLYYSMGDYPRAETLVQQALQITKTVLGEQHPSYATSLNNLGELYRAIGDYPRAEPLYQQTLQITKSVLGEQHPSYATSLNNLAALYQSMKDYPRAETLMQETLRIVKTVLGERHPDYATSLNNLAALYDSMGDYPRAEPLYQQATRIMLSHLDKTAGVLSEQQQITMNQSVRGFLDNYIGCALAMNPRPTGALEQLVAWKGAVLVRGRGMRLAAEDPAIAEQLQQLQSITRRLSALTSAVPESARQQAWRTQLAELTSEKEKLEADMMRQSATFREAIKRVSFEEVREAIPSDGALVDYFEYQGKEGRSLMASVVRPEGDSVMLELGSATEAEAAIDAWRESLGATAEAQAAGRQLRAQIWEPLLPHLTGARTIFVSTDGPLGRLPMLALPGATAGSYLIEDHALVMLPVPMLLPAVMREADDATALHTALLMGNVDYDSAARPATTVPESPVPASLVAMPVQLAKRSVDGATWAALAETGREIDLIVDLYRRGTGADTGNLIQLRGPEATESAFRAAAPGTQWLHLATHGFFAPPELKNALSAAAVAESQSRLEVLGQAGESRATFAGYSPGQLSGLVFAGVNRPPEPIDPLAPTDATDDGIMTADEIAYLRLENVELAVLSACETGLGETAGGEGILGLQRAFQVAGARTTVTSLWKVDDAATRALMVEFYHNLLERKLGKLESLRQAQLWLLNHPAAIEGQDLTRGPVRKTQVTADTRTAPDKPTRSLPEYWAAFQLSGDPR